MFKRIILIGVFLICSCVHVRTEPVQSVTDKQPIKKQLKSIEDCYSYCDKKYEDKRDESGTNKRMVCRGNCHVPGMMYDGAPY